MLGNRQSNEDGHCVIRSWRTLPPDGSVFREYITCLEDEAGEGNLNFVVVLESSYEEYDFMPCDSIDIAYDVLKDFSVTYEDLQASNFTLAYP